MILNRRGNKQNIANKIFQYFPKHKIYVEPFFGAGGLFFNKEKVQYNILNDIDSDVFNLFQVVSNQKENLEKAFYEMPVHSDLLKYWRANKETDPIKKALRFLFISNFTFNGSGHTIVYGGSKSVITTHKNNFSNKLKESYDLLFNCQFANFHYFKFLKSLMIAETEKENTFIYADPPYIIGRNDHYESGSFTEQDSIDLFNCLEETKCKFAYSEFNHPFILEQAKERNLNVIEIGERKNLGNRRTEILVCNYETELGLFDSLGGASNTKSSLAFV